MSLRSPRVHALAALLACTLAVGLIVTSTGTGGTAASGVDSGSALGRVADANRVLSRELRRLRAASSTAAARRAAREAMELARSVRVADDALGAYVVDVLERERTYVDAVGSTLNNPASPLRATLESRADALREALGRISDRRADPSQVAGESRLLAYARARRPGA